MIGLQDGDIGVGDVRLDDRFVGSGYGVLDADTKETLGAMARAEGMVLDPVYTAKVARGMMHYVEERDFVNTQQPTDEVNVLFIHTGGQAALGAYADIK